MKKVKLLAPFIALLSGAVSLLLMLKYEYKMLDMLLILLGIIVFFYILGICIQNRINKFIDANEELERQKAEEEGTVIEKDNADSEEDDDNESENDTEDNNSDDEFRIRE